MACHCRRLKLWKDRWLKLYLDVFVVILLSTFGMPRKQESGWMMDWNRRDLQKAAVEGCAVF
jgi:hypothetical protein